MAEFGVSIINDEGLKAISSNGDKITIEDWSNYDTNTNPITHQSLFTFKKVRFTNPDGTSYLFSTEGDGDSVVLSPKDVIDFPVSTQYDYDTGDGVYTLELFAVPDWITGEDYVVGNHVFVGGKFYKCIVNCNSVPVTDTTKWTEVELEDLLGTPFGLKQKFAVYCDIEACYKEKVYKTLCLLESSFCDVDLCKSKEFKQATLLWMILENIPILVDNNAWDSVITLINNGSQICCCNE
jgi:hypothetical protein